MLGHGWWSADGKAIGREPYSHRPILILQMDIEFSNGEKLSIATDETWKTSSGPITANDYATGEHYDSRLEKPGWDTPDCDDSD